MAGSMIGRVFSNRYQITECIGVGGMAEVYRAQDNVLGRIVAVKVMLPQFASDENFTKRFKQEAASAANLSSPYIVNVYDWGQDEGTYYIVMEYVRGSDLKTAINERGAINQRKVAEIGSQVCQALSVAHKQDIIHRDVKPQNIMVQPDGNVKVMDFGIARAKNSTMDKTASVLGTAHYISPEQAQGKDLTPASDIYSLGVVLYEAVTGKLPFDGPDAVSVAMKQVQEQPEPPSQLRPDLDPGLEAIILKAMSKNPNERFATAQEMRYALNDFLAGRPVDVAGFTSAQTAYLSPIGGAQTQVIGERGMGAPGGTAVMPVTHAQGGGSGSTSYRSSNTAKKKSSGKKAAGIIVAIVAVIAIIAIAAFALGGNVGTGDPVPNVVNKTLDEATQELQEAGFQVGDVTERSDNNIAEGNVIQQDPTAGSKREQGTRVNLVVSSGSSQGSVPDVTNKSADEARRILEDAGFQVQAGAAEYSDTIGKDLVARTNPAAGQQMPKNSVVTYYLSLGPEGTEVPNVVGSSKGSAETTLSNAGFKVTSENTYSDTVAQGVVISQTPNAGTLAQDGDTVHLVVSAGVDPATQKPAQVDIPNLVGWRVSDAKYQLESLGFSVYVANNMPDSAFVTSTTPTGSADKGSTVTLYAQSSSSGSDSNSDSSGSTDTGKSE
ncbi:MAG: Stk1 family PASTA domain-containing Ser/Thr kinase [Eggerthellaceae bacterium]|nr:Stk1 family PASTA domain-containing Ser/Thr kinase [Eggerthellaceae bacterium]